MHKPMIAVVLSAAALTMTACAPSPSRDVPSPGGVTGVSNSCTTNCGRIVNIQQLVGSAASGIPNASVAGVPDNIGTMSGPLNGVSGPIGGTTGSLGGLTRGATGAVSQPAMMPPPMPQNRTYRVTVAMDNGPTKSLTVRNLGGLSVGEKVKLIGNEIVPR